MVSSSQLGTVRSATGFHYSVEVADETVVGRQWSSLSVMIDVCRSCEIELRNCEVEHRKIMWTSQEHLKILNEQ